ncbi:MAG: tRNA (adenosine(37)-N6)-dimethylallyltransferase MiaA [Phycisphaerae bacterium]|nr:tRNA (adenosine(37)-N6)-dimethylallyltransferase MiaA [Phycisphaerae bacterium]
MPPRYRHPLHERYPVIIGPTAGGKTALAVEVALLLGGEVVSADSMLLYRGLDIGSAKPTTEERRGVPHHLIDVADPADRFTVSDWLAAANTTIGDIQARGRLPVVVGGTHLYIKALLDGLFDGPGADPALRAELQARDPASLRAELERIDPVAAARLHPNDLRRTIRAIEVYRLTGTPISAHQKQWDAPPLNAGPVLIGIEWPTEAVNRRINARVRAMMERGLEAEARALWASGRIGPQAAEALGYKQLFAHFRGECSYEEAVERIKIETRRFAKNQRTWARRLRTTPGAVWIDAAVEPNERWAETVAAGLHHATSPPASL